MFFVVFLRYSLDLKAVFFQSRRTTLAWDVFPSTPLEKKYRSTGGKVEFGKGNNEKQIPPAPTITRLAKEYVKFLGIHSHMKCNDIANDLVLLENSGLKNKSILPGYVVSHSKKDRCMVSP